MLFLFGAIGGLVGGTLLSGSLVGGGVGGVVCAFGLPGILGKFVGTKAVKIHAESAMGKKRSVLKAVFSFLIMAILAMVAFVIVVLIFKR